MSDEKPFVPRFAYDDTVCVKPGITYWWEPPGSEEAGPRVGEVAWIFSIEVAGEIAKDLKFPAGIVYGIEFVDGNSVFVHEDDVEACPVPDE